MRSWPSLLLLLSLIGPSALPLPRADALQLGGSTVFVRAPWKVELISYDTTVGSAPVEYFLTLELDSSAGASLGQVRLEQIRGADRNFPFSPERTRAFVGRPRREGRSVPVQADFQPRERRLTVLFPEPVPPGTTVTIVLRPWSNPTVADTYQFAVLAWPAGPDARPSPVGTATLRLYERWSR